MTNSSLYPPRLSSNKFSVNAEYVNERMNLRFALLGKRSHFWKKVIY